MNFLLKARVAAVPVHGTRTQRHNAGSIEMLALSLITYAALYIYVTSFMGGT